MKMELTEFRNQIEGGNFRNESPVNSSKKGNRYSGNHRKGHGGQNRKKEIQVNGNE